MGVRTHNRSRGEELCSYSRFGFTIDVSRSKAKSTAFEVKISTNVSKFASNAPVLDNFIFREEVAELEERISKEREKYQSAIQNSENSISAIPMIAINEKVNM